MRYIFTYLLLCVSYIYSMAQTNSLNQEKYWYYRFRLTNDFLKVGSDCGNSIPAATRDRTVKNDSGQILSNVLDLGDGTIGLGWYISVLATEYHLLSNNNQDLSQTSMELYYAMEAFNRLDKYAEAYYREEPHTYTCPASSTDLNGFYVRDDVPASFVADNMQHFNSGKTSSHVVDKVVGAYASGNKIKYPTEVSLDQSIWLMMGMALVSKLVDASANYNGLFFSDGETGFVQEAKNITDRIMSRMKNPTWEITNPERGDSCVIGIHHPDEFTSYLNLCNAGGAQAILLSYGFAKAAKEITGDGYQNLSSQATYELWNVYQALAGLPKRFREESGLETEWHKIQTLAAIGSSWDQVIFNPACILSPAQILSDLLNFIPVGPCITILPVNATSESLGLAAAIGHFEYLPLLHTVLHNKPLIIPFVYPLLLNSAPCTGPSNFGEDPGPYYDWSTPSRFRNPEDRGPQELLAQGEYNGLDYMLLYNLHHIVFADILPPYISLFNRNVNIGLPLNVLSSNIGSKANPITFNAFNQITSTSHISAGGTPETDGDVTFRAGVDIELLPGFTVEDGAEFTAYVDLFECNSSNQYQKVEAESIMFNELDEYLAVPQKPFTMLDATNETEEKSKPKTTDEILRAMRLSIYPNPAHHEATIKYIVDHPQEVSLVLYNLQGKEIQRIKDTDIHDTGIYNEKTDISDLPTGTYICILHLREERYSIQLMVGK